MHQLSNHHVDWDVADTLLLDMDGTLLDLNFDAFFWLEVIPQAYAEARGTTLAEIIDGLRATFARHRGTLNWYAIDFWTRELGFDVMALQRRYAERISWLDGAPEFLGAARAVGKRCILVTNADRKTLALKHAQTGVADHCHDVVSSHDFGLPKEHPEFWQAFSSSYAVAPPRCVFIDDTPTVLDAAHRFGIGQVLAIAQPDSRAPRRDTLAHRTIDGVRDLIEPGVAA